MDCLHNPYTLNFKSCPTWIRTKTNRTKNCCTTLILSDKQFKVFVIVMMSFTFDDANIRTILISANKNVL